ncbi:MAG TPA: hypothetical protein VK509_13980 [Polyangiales bacterium]|nr:hypothetical protein [Polyangiales bacterium]
MSRWSARAGTRRLACAAAVLAIAVSSCGDDSDGLAVDASSDAASFDASSDASSPGSPSGSDAASSCSGSAGCRCDDGACDQGLICRAGRCVQCEPGDRNCPCIDDERCDNGFVCLAGLCTVETCVVGRESCPCEQGACDDGLGCATDGLCVTCRADMSGCPCIGDSCSLDLLCDLSTSLCRKPVGCKALRAAGQCQEHQACLEGPGRDAECVPEACEAGYRWDAAAQSCVSCPDCATGASCLASAAGVGDECAAAYRTCIEADGFARCAGCVAGADEVAGVCLPKNRCGSEVCTDEQYCDRLAETCLRLPCPAGQAKGAEPGATCTPCTNSCGGVGFSGRYWPFRTQTGRCVCETFPGFFGEASGFKAERCDADDDGWVRQEADDPAIHEDEALLQNARCDILKVERVVLTDEYGGTQVIDSCRDEGFVVNGSGAPCTQPFALRLLETQRNDSPNAVSSQTTPRYTSGAGGRRLTGGELNSLTKACVDELGDFDGNGVEDLNQVQQVDFLPSSPDDERLAAFSYFVELYHSYYRERGAGETAGSLVIAERSRCDANAFPLHYSPSDAYETGSNVSPGYWRSCSRFRDPGFDGAQTEAGTDFARFSCSSATGSCGPALAGPAHPSLRYDDVDPTTTLLRNAGLCELEGNAPADARFRGLGHHSQFRCVRVTDIPAAPEELPPAEFAAGGKWTFNACTARTCAAGAQCEERQAVSDMGGYEPLLDCEAVVPVRNQVGFALRNYQPYGTSPVYTTHNPPAPATYQGGCVNEDVEWGAKLCPEPEFARGYELQSFGRYSCYGNKSRFLWASSAAGVLRPSLYWSSDPLSLPDNGSLWCFEE